MQTSKDFLHIFLDMGDALLNSGAEIFRVEDTLNRMGYACGAAQMNVFVITSSIVITMEFPEEGARTQTRRIRESGGNDFTKDDDITLKEKLSTTKGRWLLTVNDDEFFRELYKDFNIQQVSVNYSAGNATKGSGERFELIIINYDPQT